MEKSARHDIAHVVERAVGRRPQLVVPLHGGMVGEVYQLIFDDGDRAVAKIDRRTSPMLAIEGMMLRYLEAHSELPVPHVRFGADDLLIMDLLPGKSQFDRAAEEHAGELLAALHGVHADAYGFDADTLIGLLPQPNPWSDSWPSFFAEHRLLHLAYLAAQSKRMPVQVVRRVEALCTRIGNLLDNQGTPSLVHGDVWAANLLAEGGRITAVLDPAIYFGHPEVELAYIFLFNSLGQPFYDRYTEIRPLASGFFEERIVVYQLYPLLSHVCHFGGHYVQSTEAHLSRLGF